MLVLLKIPLVYLCMVVWWAIRAEPREEQPAAVARVPDTPDGPDSPGRARSAPDAAARRPSRPAPAGRPAAGRRA